MDLETAIDRLTGNADALRREGVAGLYIFGSTATGKSRPDSDVDLFFDYDDPRFSLIELVRVGRIASEILGAPADVMTRDSLHPALKQRIERSAIRVF